MLRTDVGCVGGRPSRARMRSLSTREVAGDKTVITMNLSSDSRRRYSDSEEKSTRPRILPGKLPHKLIQNQDWVQGHC
jgi:hypothetical protein